MSNEKAWFDRAVLGLAMVAVGCADDKDPNADDETGTGTEDVGDGDTSDPTDPTGDPTGDGDTGDGDTGEPVPNDIPLELELARFHDTGKYLLLRFSEPMAPVDGVDPSDFRVSLATTWRHLYTGYYGPYLYESSNYADPNIFLGYDYYNYDYKPLVADLIGNGNKPTDIVIRFADPFEPAFCETYLQMQADYELYDSQPNSDARIALFPHYSPGAVEVMSADGEVLAAIGAEWVETEDVYMSEYEFGWPNLDPRVSIPCTVVGP